MTRTFLVLVPACLSALLLGLWLQPAGSRAVPPVAQPATTKPADPEDKEPPPERQERAPVRLPITQAVLYSSGVAHFVRQGEVEGNERVSLAFHARDINDLLKSLDLEDLSGGKIGTVGYSSQEPVERSLQSYSLDLAGNPSSSQVLNQARGEKIEVQLKGGPGQLLLVTGQLMGVERLKVAVGKDTFDVEQLNLWCTEGLRTLQLAEVQRIRFLNPTLTDEVKQALDLLARTHNSQKKTLTLQCDGAGKRKVKASYVVEHPIWKASYRLALPKEGKPSLRGWALIDNPTDEDWKGVQLGLVAGRPISFRMDLHSPLYVPRPLVEPERFAQLRPPSYQGKIKDSEPGIDFPTPKIPELPKVPSPDAKPKPDPVQEPPAPPVKYQELGDSYAYTIETPIDLLRQQSVLAPILRKEVEARRVSIYNESVQPKHPLLGLVFKNTSGLHLAQGPVTVSEGSAYAGDAQLPDMQPNEERLLSFAVDLGVEVAPRAGNTTQRLTRVRLHKGVLFATSLLRDSKTYAARNRSDRERTLLIEHPVRPEYKLVGPEKPAEMTRDRYRFQVKLPGDRAVTLDVTEERMLGETMLLARLEDDRFRFYLAQPALSEPVKTALRQVIGLRDKLAETRGTIARKQKELKEVVDDQARIRTNLEQVNRDLEASKRFLKKLEERESEIEKLQGELRTLETTREKQTRELEEFLQELNVE